MLAKYQVAAGAAINDVLADIVAILTGTTDKSLLSASCDQANSYILTTYNAAGWTMHDNVSATQKILTAPAYDALQNKYLDLYVSGANIRSRIWEGWNAGTHVGTNGTGDNTDRDHFVGAATTGRVFYIYATARTVQVQGSNGSWAACTMEYSRDEWPTLSVDVALVNQISINPIFSANIQYTAATCPRVVSAATGLVGTGNNQTYPCTQHNGTLVFNPANSAYGGRNAANQTYTAVLPIQGNAGGSTHAYANFSTYGDTHVVCQPGVSPLDEFSFLGKTYVVLPLGTPNHGLFACPKG